jgi:hypothetical protein
VRKKCRIEAAAAVLGNSLGIIAEVYAETVFEQAVHVMREMGQKPVTCSRPGQTSR